MSRELPLKYVALLAALFSCSTLSGQVPGSRDNKQSVASAGPPASTAVQAPQFVEGRGKDDLTYGPVFYPRRIELTADEVATIRAAVAKQALAFHESLVEQNVAASGGHKLTLQRLSASATWDEWNRRHSEQVLANQFFYSQIIFWVVLAIVAVAISLTLFQFVKDSALAERAARILLGRQKPGTIVEANESRALIPDPELVKALAAIAANYPDQRASAAEVWKLLRGQHTITLSPSGLQLGSQLVGLVILAFALGFFYLYLDKVYPVTAASVAQLPARQASSPITQGSDSKPANK